MFNPIMSGKTYLPTHLLLASDVVLGERAAFIREGSCVAMSPRPVQQPAERR